MSQMRGLRASADDSRERENYVGQTVGYLLAAEAQRKDYVVELVSEDVFTYNDQVVKQLAMISENTTIKEARQSIQCA